MTDPMTLGRKKSSAIDLIERLEMFATCSFLERAPEIKSVLYEAADKIRALQRTLQLIENSDHY